MTNTTDNQSTPTSAKKPPLTMKRLKTEIDENDKRATRGIADVQRQVNTGADKLKAHKTKVKGTLNDYANQLADLRKEADTGARKSRGITSAHKRMAQLEILVQQLIVQMEGLDATPTNDIGIRRQTAELTSIEDLINQTLGDLPEEVGRLKTQVNAIAGEQTLLRSDLNDQGDHINQVVAGHNQLDQRVSRLQQLREKFPAMLAVVAAVIGTIAALIYWNIDQTLSVQLGDGSWKTFSSPELNSWPVTVGFGVAAFLAVLGILLLIPMRGEDAGNSTSTAVPAYEPAATAIPVATKPLPVTPPSYPGAEASTEPVMAQGAPRTH